MRAAVLLFFVVCSFSLFESVESWDWFDNYWNEFWKHWKERPRWGKILGATIGVMVAPDENWNCGSTKVPISLKIAMIASKSMCTQRSPEVNEACLQHDLCYDARRGQAHCDEIFCERLRNMEECFWVANVFCGLVKKYGHISYDNPDKLRRLLRQKGIIPPSRSQNVTKF